MVRSDEAETDSVDTGRRMTWFCIDITEACVSGGAYHRLCRRFQQAFIAAGAPAEMALFAQTLLRDGVRKVYLSPGSAPYVKSLIDAYEGTPCDCPGGDGLTLVFGVPDATSRLLSSPEAATVEETVHEKVLMLPNRARSRSWQALAAS